MFVENMDDGQSIHRAAAHDDLGCGARNEPAQISPPAHCRTGGTRQKAPWLDFEIRYRPRFSQRLQSLFGRGNRRHRYTRLCERHRIALENALSFNDPAATKIVSVFHLSSKPSTRSLRSSATPIFASSASAIPECSGLKYFSWRFSGSILDFKHG